nr:MAG TPA: prohead serine protease [Caudoviricetes sp.]
MNQYTKAYGKFEIKEASEDQRIIKGIATTQTLDRDGDIVEPNGAEFALPIPFLWQHQRDKPIGEVIAARVTDKGIEVEIHLAQINESGKLKERLDEAWHSIKSGLVKGLSIGFRGKEYARTESGIHYTKWDWHELSAVTVPANSEATITAIKAAALGQPEKQSEPISPPTAAETAPTKAQSEAPASSFLTVKLPIIGQGVKL